MYPLIVQRYFFYKIFQATLLIVCIFLCVHGILFLVESEQTSWMDFFMLYLKQSLIMLYESFPYILFICSYFVFSFFKDNSILIIFEASTMSRKHFLCILTISWTLLLSIVCLLYESAVYYDFFAYEGDSHLDISTSANTFERGYWFQSGEFFIHVEEVNKFNLKNIVFVRYNETDLSEMIFANKGVCEGRRCDFFDVREMAFLKSEVVKKDREDFTLYFNHSIHLMLMHYEEHYSQLDLWTLTYLVQALRDNQKHHLPQLKILFERIAYVPKNVCLIFVLFSILFFVFSANNFFSRLTLAISISMLSLLIGNIFDFLVKLLGQEYFYTSIGIIYSLIGVCTLWMLRRYPFLSAL